MQFVRVRTARGWVVLASDVTHYYENMEAGWPFTAELKLAYDDEIKNWKLEFDFGEDAKREGESGEPVDFSGQESLGACPKCKGHVYEHGASYVCEHAVGAHVTCDFKSGKIILQQPVPREQMSKLLATGKTDYVALNALARAAGEAEEIAA